MAYRHDTLEYSVLTTAFNIHF